MSILHNRTKYWGHWLIIALAMALCFFIFPQHKASTSVMGRYKQQYSYSPFNLNHFTIGIRPEDFEFMFSDRPRSLFAYQDVEFVLNRLPITYRAKMRIRGTHAWNWDKPKPSFRLRLKGQKRVFARDTFDFINPDDASMLANLVADYLAVGMNIPSPRTTICTVTLNDDYKGLYHLVEPMSPETMEQQGFSGHSVIEGNLRNSKMWHHPELWEMQVGNGRDGSEPLNCLTKLLEIVKTPVDLTKIEQLSTVMDTDRLASWSALMTAIGGIHTTDFLGNVFIFDHKERKLFPAISDSTGFGVITSMSGMHAEVDVKVSPYEFLTPLMNAFFRIPEFQFKRNQALYGLLLHELSHEKLAILVDKFMNVLKPLYYKENYATALINVPIVLFSRKIPVSPETQIADAKRLLDFMDARREYLLGLLRKSIAIIFGGARREQIAGRWYTQLVVQVSGNCPIEWDFSGFRGKILPGISSMGGGFVDGLESFYSLQKLYPGLRENTSDGPLWLMLDRRWAKFGLEPSSQSYSLGISEEHFGECLDFLQNTGRNSITGETVQIKYIESPLNPHGLDDHNSTVLHAWRNWKNGQN